VRAVARLAALSLTVGLSIGPGTAQTGGTPVETPPVPLSPEKQAIIKEHVGRAQLPPAEIDGPVSVGMDVPAAVALFALPQDTVTEVPTVTNYKFFAIGNTIAVVEPESRKVIQIIKN
jgi:Protein of unknown function (DUF1236)